MTLALIAEADTNSEQPLNMRPIQNKGKASHNRIHCSDCRS